jgi:hypothetical protein
MGTKTHLAGAYRSTRGNSADATVNTVDTVETFTYAAGDILLRQDGWTLSSMHETGGFVTALRATGRWDHPLHRGSWHRIVTEWAEIARTTPDGSSHRVAFQLQGAELAVSFDARTTRHWVPEGSLLVPDLHACLGPMVETASRSAPTEPPGAVCVLVIPRLCDGAEPQSFDTCWLTVQRVGRAVLATPDGPVRADEYSVDLQPGPADTRGHAPAWTSATRLYIGGDGLLAGYGDGEAMVWRAASAPSRA